MYHFQTNGKLPISSKSQDTFSPHQLVRDIFITTRKVAFFHQMLTCHFLFTCFRDESHKDSCLLELNKINKYHHKTKIVLKHLRFASIDG
jgi:hypothetical protein